MALWSASPTSPMLVWRPCSTTGRPATTTSVTSAAVAAKTRCSTAVSGRRACGARRVEADGREVGRRADGQPAVVPAQRAHARGGRCPQQLRGRMEPAAAGDQSLVELERAHLLEQVDHGVHVAADGQRRSGGWPARSPARCRPLGRARSWDTGRSWYPDDPSSSMSAAVRCVPCTAVVSGPSTPACASSAGRGHPRGGQALLVLARLLGEVYVQRGAPPPGPVADRSASMRDRPP